MTDEEQAQLQRVAQVAADAIGALARLAGAQEPLLLAQAIVEHALHARMDAAADLTAAVEKRVRDMLTATTVSEHEVNSLRAAAVEQARLIAYIAPDANTREQIERNLTREDYSRLARDAAASVRKWKADANAGRSTVVDLSAHRAALEADAEWAEPTPAQRDALGLDGGGDDDASA